MGISSKISRKQSLIVRLKLFRLKLACLWHGGRGQKNTIPAFWRNVILAPKHGFKMRFSLTAFSLSTSVTKENPLSLFN